MPATTRLSASQLYPGKTVLAPYYGHGVPASVIHAAHPLSVLWNEVDFYLNNSQLQPSDEIRVELLTKPSLPTGTVLMDSYGNLSVEGAPDGWQGSGTYQWHVNGVLQSSGTYEVSQGDAIGTGIINATTNATAALSGSVTIDSAGVVNATTDDAVAALVGASAPTGQGVMAATTADAVAALTGQSGVVSTAVMSATTGDADASLVGVGVIAQNNKGLGRGPIRVWVTGMY